MIALDVYYCISICTAVGMVPSPFDCYLANRGLKTLHLRMREHQRNAMAMAQLLSNSPHVTETIFPGQLLWEREGGERGREGREGLIYSTFSP